MIEYLLLFIIIILSICLFISYIQIKKKANNLLQKELEILKVKKEKNFIKLENYYKNKEENIKKLFEERQNIYNNSIQLTNKNIQEEESRRKLILLKNNEILNKELENLRIVKEEQLKEKLNQSITMIDQAVESYKKKKEDEKQKINEELNIIRTNLEECRAQQNQINEILRKTEESNNEINFHRIILSSSDKEDIKYLLSIEDKIHNKDLLHKLIWSEYLQKPFNQMLNNIFGGKIPKNVIYCIENFTTHKKYIGKTSAEVSKRWTEHIKSSLGIGGIKKQKIHEALFEHWDEYIFFIIEETTKEQLNEKEKYYISFFETDKYGFNQKSGG